ncbi:MAG: hypothetical protein MI922_04660 [Bacteroidales bacterium]|nr:hypothetical protein [Bacteroidales bacterium]
MKAIFLNLVLIGLLCSCAKEDSNIDQLTFDDFKSSLTVEMDYGAIVETFGEPDRDIGSGIHIYVYELNDATEIWIGFIDSIIYAKHMDQDQNVLHVLY